MTNKKLIKLIAQLVIDNEQDEQGKQKWLLLFKQWEKELIKEE